MPNAPPEKTAPPTPTKGEQTGAQAFGGVAGLGSMIPGFGKPPPGSITTYRMMRANPTIALARLVESAPIKATSWSFEAADDARPGALEFIEAALTDEIDALVKNALLAYDYGFSAWEKVWKVDRVDGVMRLVYHKLKALLVDITEARIDKDDGSFGGAKQKDVVLDPEYVLWFTHDGEPGNEWFGRSKNENLRIPWNAWNKLHEAAGKYGHRAAGPIPLIQYPPGNSQNASGSEVANFTIGQGILANLQSGNGILAPNELVKWAEAFANRGGDPSKLKSWLFDFIEPKNRYGDDYVKLLSHEEKLMVRGRLLPERAVLEGEHGTKAEASVHTDIVLSGAQDFLTDLATCINWYLIDPLLVMNYGEDARGSVTANPAPLVDEQRSLLRDMTMKILSAPTNVDRALAIFNIDAAMDQLGLPKIEGEPEPDDSIPPPDKADEDLTATMLGVYAGLEKRVKAMR